MLLGEFEEGDYSYLFNRQAQLYRFVGRVLENWSFNRAVYEAYFKQFLDLIKTKIEFMCESEAVYSVLLRVQAQLEGRLDYYGSRKWLNAEDKLEDTLFTHYIQYMQSKSNRNGVYYIRNPRTNDKMPILDYIATCPGYYRPHSSWRDIFALVTASIARKETPGNNALPSPRGTLDYDEPDLACYGCTSFYELDANLHMPEVCDQLLVLAGTTRQINLPLIKEEACALLNSRKGGVILLDCIKNSVNVLARGEYLSEKEKGEIRSKI